MCVITDRSTCNVYKKNDDKIPRERVDDHIQWLNNVLKSSLSIEQTQKERKKKTKVFEDDNKSEEEEKLEGKEKRRLCCCCIVSNKYVVLG